jgi:hypothetical protein
VRKVRLSVEGLEDRLTPSGGPPTAPSNQGGPPANSGPGNDGQGTTANVPIQQLLAGYPVPPSLGPAPAGTLITANPSAIPAALQGGRVSVVPVQLTGGATLVVGGAPAAGSLTLSDPATGATYVIPVTLVPPPAPPAP